MSEKSSVDRSIGWLPLLFGLPSTTVAPRYSKTSPAIGPEAIRTFLPASSRDGVSCEEKSAVIAVPVGFQPMKLRATAIPIPTATPPPPPAAPEAATAPTIASIVAALLAVTVTDPTLLAAVPRPLFSTKALVLVRMTLVDSAPPPATATPPPPPRPSDTAAATDVARIDESSCAVTTTAPLAMTSSAFRMTAVVSVAIVLWASETPTEIAAPTAPPIPTATATAPASARILDESVAVTAIDCAEIPAPSPSMAADSDWPIRFTDDTPAPLAARPATPPPAIAADPASTSESIRWPDSATIARLPVVVMRLFSDLANTPTSATRLPFWS